MNSNLSFQEYNYDYSTNKIPFNTSINKNRNNNINRNKSYNYKSQHNQKRDEIQNSYNNIYSLTERENNTNKYRISNLEERISSLEKMLHYFDEFIHLKEQEKKDNDGINNIPNMPIEPLVIKINNLEKEIQNLKKEKEENKKIILELNEKIITLEKKLDNNRSDDMKDIIYSLSDKEKKLNLLVNDFSDMAKESSNMINKIMNERIDKINIFNENRINELLIMIRDINKIIEENENKVNKVDEIIENIQKDNLNIIKYISVQNQKINGVDIIMNEINNLKEKFYLIMNDNNYINNINTKIENII